MTKFIFLSSILATVIAAATANAVEPSYDRYKNFADLAQHEAEGKAYHVDVVDRHSPVTIIAIHGGNIEPGSAELAREVAGRDFNLYAFIATLPDHNKRLHVTSTHFDDPRAYALVKPAKVVISIHGFKEKDHDVICMGGANTSRRDRLAREIKKSGLGFELQNACKEIGGVDPQNIVNLGKEPGVQLELSIHLRDRLLADKSLMKKLADLIRAEALHP